jgi:hypothetical protein
MNDIQLVSVGARGRLEPRWDRLAGRLHVIAVDADEDALIHGRARRFDVVRRALADTERDATLYLTRKSDCSSLFTPNAAFLRRFADPQRFDVVAERRIATQPLSALSCSPHFIKIDAQGAELMILKGAAPLLATVIGIEVEVEFAPIYKDQPLFGEVDAFLRSHDFELCDLSRVYWRSLDNKRRLIFGDALYFKRPDLIASPEIGALLSGVYSRTLWERLAGLAENAVQNIRQGPFEVDATLET